MASSNDSDNPCKLFVGNLPYMCTNEDVANIFRPFGTVQGVKIVRDRQTNRSKGFGFITYTDPASVEKAINALNGTMLEERPLSVKRQIARGVGPEDKVDPMLAGIRKTKKGDKLPGWGSW